MKFRSVQFLLNMYANHIILLILVLLVIAKRRSLLRRQHLQKKNAAFISLTTFKQTGTVINKLETIYFDPKHLKDWDLRRPRDA